jgi:hypothetical protein
MTRVMASGCSTSCIGPPEVLQEAKDQATSSSWSWPRTPPFAGESMSRSPGEHAAGADLRLKMVDKATWEARGHVRGRGAHPPGHHRPGL